MITAFMRGLASIGAAFMTFSIFPREPRPMITYPNLSDFLRRYGRPTVADTLLVICLLSCWSLQAQDGPNVNPTEGPPVRAFTSLYFYDGSSRLEYICMAESNSRTWTLTISAASNATPIAMTTVEDHGLQTGALVTQANIEGNTAANGTFQIVVTGAKTYTLKDRAGTDVAGNGAWVSGSGTITTTAPRTNQAQWSIQKLTYNGSGLLTTKKWIEGATGLVSSTAGKVCDNRATYGSQ